MYNRNVRYFNIRQKEYANTTISINAFYNNRSFPFPLVPPTPFAPSRTSGKISLNVTYLFSGVVAIFVATTIGSIKSIKTLAGDEAKFAPAYINSSK